MVMFWKYGVSIRVFRLFVYAGYNPNYPVLFSEQYGGEKVYRLFGFVFRAHKLNSKETI